MSYCAKKNWAGRAFEEGRDFCINPGALGLFWCVQGGTYVPPILSSLFQFIYRYTRSPQTKENRYAWFTRACEFKGEQREEGERLHTSPLRGSTMPPVLKTIPFYSRTVYMYGSWPKGNPESSNSSTRVILYSSRRGIFPRCYPLGHSISRVPGTTQS